MNIHVYVLCTFIRTNRVQEKPTISTDLQGFFVRSRPQTTWDIFWAWSIPISALNQVEPNQNCQTDQFLLVLYGTDPVRILSYGSHPRTHITQILVLNFNDVFWFRTWVMYFGSELQQCTILDDILVICTCIFYIYEKLCIFVY